MGLFNRYDVKDKSLEYSFNEFNDKYCNPKDYMVTKEECDKYLDELIVANKFNKEYNKRRRKIWMRMAYTCVVVFVISILCLLTLLSIWLSEDDVSVWALLIIWIVSIIIIPVINWIIRIVEKQIKDEIYYTPFYPKVNVNVEKLFDDYLWKWKLERDTVTKNTDKQLIVRREEYVRRMENDSRNNYVKYTSADMYKGSIDYEDLFDAKIASFGVGDLLDDV